MNTPVILISILLVLAVFVPFFILNSSGKGASKLISKQVKQIVKGDRLKFDLKEGWGSSFIAIDRAQKTLLFAEVVNDEVVVEKIALDQVAKSAIQKKLKLEKTNMGNANVLQKLDLVITFSTGHNETLLLNFYNADNSYTEDYEMQRAEKWETIINEAVKAMALERKVA
ncbi:MAG TPA: hypothetical protein VKZ93_03825 [Arenibacter sp.]|nr:hypothetical protein [Arenibacter sp.]